MTHEELLAKIDAELATNYADECGNFPTGLKALRAIVDLATTYKDENYVNEEFNQGLQTAFRLVIQAIEKELV